MLIAQLNIICNVVNLINFLKLFSITMSRNNVKYFYAVGKGRQTGVFNSWPECLQQVNGFSNAKFKKFKTYKEAEEFVNHWRSNASSQKEPQSQYQPHKSNLQPQSNRNGLTAQVKKRKRSKSNSRSGTPEESQPSTSSETDRVKIKKKKLTFEVGPDDYVNVYTDGCCHNNGKSSAKAGIGVWFGKNHPLNISRPLDGPATNNNGEIQAARTAIVSAAEAGVSKLKIHTDSGFLLDCINKYMKTWKINGWKLSGGGPVKNRVELEKLDEAMKLINIKWEKVPAHSGVYGNEMADKLANEGARFYRS